MAYEHFDPNDLTLRDRLAIDRTRLANERTLLSYLRTAFMLIIAGGTAIRMFGDSLFVVVSGWGLVAFGSFFLVLGAYRFVVARRAIERSGAIRDSLSEIVPQSHQRRD